MATDEGELGLDGPVTVASVQVGVADTTAVELDETLAGGKLGGLLDRVVVDDLERLGRLLDDGGLLDFGDVEGHGGGAGGGSGR